MYAQSFSYHVIGVKFLYHKKVHNRPYWLPIRCLAKTDECLAYDKHLQYGKIIINLSRCLHLFTESVLYMLSVFDRMNAQLEHA